MKRLPLAILLALFAFGVHADSWAPARVQARASAGGEYVVRVVPGKSMGDVYGYAGTPKGKYATAEWHRFDGHSYKKVSFATLLNPIAPVDIEVTASGSLITLDNWHNLGVGKAVVLYAADGRVIRALTLPEMYSSADLANVDRSVSSVHWRCMRAPSTSLERSDQELSIDDSIGGRFVFQVLTGEFEYQRGGGGCKS